MRYVNLCILIPFPEPNLTASAACLSWRTFSLSLPRLFQSPPGCFRLRSQTGNSSGSYSVCTRSVTLRQSQFPVLFLIFWIETPLWTPVNLWRWRLRGSCHTYFSLVFKIVCLHSDNTAVAVWRSQVLDVMIAQFILNCFCLDPDIICTLISKQIFVG